MSSAKLSGEGFSEPGLETFVEGGVCALEFDQCKDGVCDLKVFVTWAGTDREGRNAVSAGFRFTRFAGYSVGSMYNWAVFGVDKAKSDLTNRFLTPILESAQAAARRLREAILPVSWPSWEDLQRRRRSEAAAPDM